MLLGILRLLFHCSDSFRECACLICRKENGRAGMGSERVGCPEATGGWSPRLPVAGTGVRKREKEAYAEENGYVW